MALVSLLCTAYFVLASGSLPEPRLYHSMTSLADGTAVLFGGWSLRFFTDHADERIFNDTYSLKVSSSGAAVEGTEQFG